MTQEVLYLCLVVVCLRITGRVDVAADASQEPRSLLRVHCLIPAHSMQELARAREFVVNPQPTVNNPHIYANTPLDNDYMYTKHHC